MKFEEITCTETLEQAVPLLIDLRSHLTKDDLIGLINEMRSNHGYKLVGYFSKNQCLAAMGYRILTDLVHGKHLYIDDLVVSEGQRGKGIGRLMLSHAEEIATKHSCHRLRLCTGINHENGKAFYRKIGWDERAVVFKKSIHLKSLSS